MIYVFYIALGFLAIRFTVAVVNLIARPYLRDSAPTSQTESVSILIPARNEVKNIGLTLERLAELDYPQLEVIVLDDSSTDDTLAIASSYAERDNRFQVMQGRKLPETWLGKNWACHQLAQRASGDYLLFIDADVTLKKGAIRGGLAEMKAHQLSLLSIFPDQLMQSQGEKLVVPVMHYLLLSLLPLPLVTASKNPAFAAANGQYMLFSAEDYRKNQWHEQVKQEIVEDIEIMRQVKKAGHRGRVLLGNHLVKCRMYHNFKEGWHGFSKNLLAGFNHSIIGLLVFLFLVVFAWSSISAVTDWKLVGGFLSLALGLRAVLSVLGKQSIGYNLLAHPLQMVIWTGIGFRSIWLRLTGKNEWKGRNITFKPAQKSVVPTADKPVQSH